MLQRSSGFESCNLYFVEPEAICHQRRLALHHNMSTCKADRESHNLKSYSEDCRSEKAKNGRMLLTASFQRMIHT